MFGDKYHDRAEFNLGFLARFQFFSRNRVLFLLRVKLTLGSVIELLLSDLALLVGLGGA